MTKLLLKSIECFVQQESGRDEPYLNFNGQKIWSGSMEEGDTNQLTYNREFDFDGASSLSLWEKDSGLRGKDDHMGTKHISDLQSNGEAFYFNFTGSGGNYQLYVDVIA